MHRIPLLALAGLLAFAHPTLAQIPIESGDTIRFARELPRGDRGPRIVMGTFMEVRDDTLVVRVGSAPLLVPVGLVRDVDVRRGVGPASVRRGMGFGAIFGGLAGVAVGAMVAADSDGFFDTGPTAAIVGAGGALIGSVIGALVTAGRTEPVWERLSWPEARAGVD